MISVIMTSYLSPLEHSAKNLDQKFIRAVNSFISQDIGSEHCELIIVSDGCEITNRLYQEYFSQVSNIILIEKEKSSNRYPGEYRQIGIEASKFDYITYLDADDFFLENRLSNCYKAITESKKPFVLDVVYNIPKSILKQNLGTKFGEFNHFGIDFIKLRVRWDSGTFQFIHRKNIGVSWKGSDNRGEDFHFSKQALTRNRILPSSVQMEIDGYVVCHNHTFGFDV